jgi:hypothetical protein
LTLVSAQAQDSLTHSQAVGSAAKEALDPKRIRVAIRGPRQDEAHSLACLTNF